MNIATIIWPFNWSRNVFLTKNNDPRSFCLLSGTCTHLSKKREELPSFLTQRPCFVTFVHFKRLCWARLVCNICKKKKKSSYSTPDITWSSKPFPLCGVHLRLQDGRDGRGLLDVELNLPSQLSHFGGCLLSLRRFIITGFIDFPYWRMIAMIEIPTNIISDV